MSALNTRGPENIQYKIRRMSPDMSGFHDTNMTYGNITEKPLTMLQNTKPNVLLTDERKIAAIYEAEETTTPRTSAQNYSICSAVAAPAHAWICIMTENARRQTFSSCEMKNCAPED